MSAPRARPAQTTRGFDRLVNLGDAVTAISLTLLVVPLVELRTSNPRTPTLDLLSGHRWELLSFLLSFIVIGQLWLAHHRVFEEIDAYDGVILLANGVWTFTVAFLPFPTQLLGSGSNSRPEVTIYIATLAVSSAALSVIRWHARAHPELSAGGDALDAIDREIEPVGVSFGLLVVALVAAIAVPGLGAWALLVLLLRGLTSSLIRRVRAADPDAVASPAPRPDTPPRER